MIRFALPVIAALALSACEDAVPMAGDESANTGFVRITTAAEFNRLVVGKPMFDPESENDTSVIAADGTLSGEWNGSAFHGTWLWENGTWCRTILTGNQSTDCQIIEINGNQMRGTRDSGNGDSYIMILQ